MLASISFPSWITWISPPSRVAGEPLLFDGFGRSHESDRYFKMGLLPKIDEICWIRTLEDLGLVGAIGTSPQGAAAHAGYSGYRSIKCLLADGIRKFKENPQCLRLSSRCRCVGGIPQCAAIRASLQTLDELPVFLIIIWRNIVNVYRISLIGLT